MFYMPVAIRDEGVYEVDLCSACGPVDSFEMTAEELCSKVQDGWFVAGLSDDEITCFSDIEVYIDYLMTYTELFCNALLQFSFEPLALKVTLDNPEFFDEQTGVYTFPAEFPNLMENGDVENKDSSGMLEKVRKVVFPKSVEWYHGNLEAFKNLEELCIPGFTHFCALGVGELPKLKALDFPDTLTTIEGSVFAHTYIESMILPDTVETVEDSAFVDSHIKMLRLPKGLKVIETQLCQGCKELETVQLPDELEIIKWDAFNDCHKLHTITFPTTLTEIGSSAFESSGLTALDITSEADCLQIGDFAFRDCTELRNVRIKATKIQLGAYAFYKCTALESVELLGTLQFDEKACFTECSALKELRLPEGMDGVDTLLQLLPDNPNLTVYIGRNARNRDAFEKLLKGFKFTKLVILDE